MFIRFDVLLKKIINVVMLLSLCSTLIKCQMTNGCMFCAILCCLDVLLMCSLSTKLTCMIKTLKARGQLVYQSNTFHVRFESNSRNLKKFTVL